MRTLVGLSPVRQLDVLRYALPRAACQPTPTSFEVEDALQMCFMSFRRDPMRAWFASSHVWTARSVTCNA